MLWQSTCCAHSDFAEAEEVVCEGPHLPTLLCSKARHAVDAAKKPAATAAAAAGFSGGESPNQAAGHVYSAGGSSSSTGGISRLEDALAEAAEAEVEAIACERVTSERPTWLAAQEELERARRRRELAAMIEQSRIQGRKHSSSLQLGGGSRASRYGTDVQLPPFDRTRHVPTLALINPRSGAASGEDILKAARDTPYYQDRFFNIIDVVKGKKPGGLLDVFRVELNAAKEEAKLLGVRPRIISGGGDGTASFALFIVFSALKADDSRPEPELHDTGNGFMWTDDELRDCFPALAQMPLGSANDFANALGWGQKYPGDPAGNCFATRQDALRALHRWILAVIDPASRVANFDLWGIMPPPGEEQVDFKICELTGRRGFNPKCRGAGGEGHLAMKVAATPVPFFVCLYFSTGFAAYMVARFQINRRSHPLTNKMEYARQAIGIAAEATPPQLEVKLDKVEISCGEEAYFPPSRGDGEAKSGQLYREVGFFNINKQANMLRGANRADACARLTCVREPAMFNDGHLDMYRMKFRSLLKNPGVCFQTDKRKEMTLSFSGGLGKGMFFQWDGESRFAFSPSGRPFHVGVRKVLNLPVVLGPFYDEKLCGDPDNGQDVAFAFAGETPEAREAVRRRVLRYVRGELEAEMNATQDELNAAGMARQAPACP